MSHAPSPRFLAAQMVQAVIEDGRMLSDISLTAADPADRARAQRLAMATLRNLGRAEHVLAPHLRKEPAPLVKAVLRVATVEMLELNAAPHGVVGEAVSSLRKSRKTQAAAGMANAVLRKVSTVTDWNDMPLQRLPGWLRRRLKRAYGEEVVSAIEAAHAKGAQIDLTLKPELSDTQPEGTRLASGSLRLPQGAQVSALPGYEAGDWWVQDAAAALPARLLNIQPGQRVLDLCAAPGGKTLQLAAAGAEVTALDLSEARLERLSENLARTGLRATTVAADALAWSPDAPFDAVLLDAPCSATGTIRRHPDLPLIRKPADVEGLVTLQAQLLDRALGFVKPGGTLVYCTCSLLPDEGEDQITVALERHPNLRVAPVAPQAFGHATPEGGWRTRPDDLDGGCDGFYMACLRNDPT